MHHTMKMYWGGVKFNTLITLALDGRMWPVSHLSHLIPDTYWIEGFSQYPEKRGSRFFQNTGKPLQHYTARCHTIRPHINVHCHETSKLSFIADCIK
jgi:hypothetical protein